MTDLTPDHPAVLAAARAMLKAGWTCDTHEPEEWGVCPYCTESHLRTARRALTAALPHLTADDLRDTDAAEEIRTEGWQQGWAAGRDLDGDEDATPHLRNTPAGRALMAEGKSAGWDDALNELRKGQGMHRALAGTLATRKPNYGIPADCTCVPDHTREILTKSTRVVHSAGCATRHEPHARDLR